MSDDYETLKKLYKRYLNTNIRGDYAAARDWLTALADELQDRSIRGEWGNIGPAELRAIATAQPDPLDTLPPIKKLGHELMALRHGKKVADAAYSGSSIASDTEQRYWNDRAQKFASIIREAGVR